VEPNSKDTCTHALGGVFNAVESGLVVECLNLVKWLMNWSGTSCSNNEQILC